MSYVQGALDGLCGPYSVMNAFTAAARPRRVKEEDAKKVFACLMDSLHERGEMPTALSEGTNLMTLMQLIRDASDTMSACVGGELSVRLAARRKLSLDAYWELLRSHLSEPGSAAIIGLWGSYDHWTCATGATTRSLILTDSGVFSDRRILTRQRCTVGYPSIKRPHSLMPTQTILLRFDLDS